MKYELVEVNKHFELQKGISYTSKELVDESDTGLLTINAFNAGGGFKLQSEKPFGGDLKPEFLLSEGDVLLAMTEQDAGLLASPLTIKSDYSKFSNLTFSLDVAKVLSTSGQIEPNFLYNVLRIPAFRERAAYGDTGSTVQRLPYEAFGELKIPRPPLGAQSAIVKIVDDIDSKIFINKRAAETLEQIAQTIFKSWFVDFDPVHAKTRGEQPEGMDEETASLFPDSFEDSELGPIPLGWVVSTIGETSNLVMGQSPPGESYNETGDGLPFFQGRTDFGPRFPTERVYTTAGKRFAKAGDTLISVRAPVGDANQALTECVVGRGVAAIRHNSDSEIYTYTLLASLRPKLEYFNGEGTVFGAINRKDFEELAVVEPSAELVASFENLLGPSNALIRQLHDENLTLSRLRDSLLPRLISGDLEIPEELLGE